MHSRAPAAASWLEALVDAWGRAATKLHRFPRSWLLPACALALLAQQEAARAESSFYTDRSVWQSAVTDIVTEIYESYPWSSPGGDLLTQTQITLGGIQNIPHSRPPLCTLCSGRLYGIDSNAVVSDAPYHTGQYLHYITDLGPRELQINLSAPATAIAFDYGERQGSGGSPVRVQLVEGGIRSDSIVVATASDAYAFVGATATTPFTGIVITALSTPEVPNPLIGIDDLSVAAALPVCSDGRDNDGDGLVDYPADPGCADSSSDSEAPECNDGVDNDGDGFVDYPNDPECSAASSRHEAQCSDGIDNDGDGLVDHPDDPECDDPNDPSEYPACSDGVDNDADGVIDYPADPNCSSPSDPLEQSEGVECSNGVDDDGDGLTDTDDPGCPSSASTPENPLCNNGRDDDGDGLIDFDDSGCTAEWPYWEGRPGCGLGAELVLVTLAMGLRRRARR